MVPHCKLTATVVGCAFAVMRAASAVSDTGSHTAASTAVSTACAVSMGSMSGRELRVNVAGRPLVLAPMDSDSPVALSVYPVVGQNAVLVTYVGHTDNAPQGGGRLWRVSCADGMPETFVHIADADFGHAALSADRRTLFFTGADGVFALDLTTRRARRLTTAASTECLRSGYPTLDVVVGLDGEGALAFERGCGYEHEWHAVAMVLRNPGMPGMRVTRMASPRRPLAVAVATGAGGWIWLADRRCGDDESTINQVKVSSDTGERWRTIVVKMLVAQPVRYMIADSARPGAALLFTDSCESDEHTDPAWIYVTDDGGQSFRPIAVPPGIATADDGRAPAEEKDPIRAVAAPNGSLTQLILYGQSTQIVPSLVGRWESLDLGRTWRVLPPVSAPPELDPIDATSPASGRGISIRKDGVYLWQRRGEAGTRIYPRG
jgi:hypothetical protein